MFLGVQNRNYFVKIRYADATANQQGQVPSPRHSPIRSNIFYEFYLSQSRTMRNSFIKGFLILVVALATMGPAGSDRDAPKSVVKLLFCRS